MAKIESRLKALGLILPPAFTPPPGVVLPFVNVRLIGHRAVIAGHGPQSPEGPLAKPLGKVGGELTLEQGYFAAKLTALSMLGYLKRTLGDLDRISHWVRIFGMVNSAPGFVQQPAVINGFSDLILELYGHGNQTVLVLSVFVMSVAMLLMAAAFVVLVLMFLTHNATSIIVTRIHVIRPFMLFLFPPVRTALLSSSAA